ncbi:MAG: hypothetical protein U0457_00345 [Candidatus Sericytochromatia bacterium]
MNIAEKKTKLKKLLTTAEKYQKKADEIKSKKTYQEAIELIESIKDKKILVDFIKALAESYALTNNFNSAEEYFNKEIDIRKTLNDEQNLSIALLNLSWVNSKKGNLNREYELILEANKYLANNNMFFQLSENIIRIYRLDNKKNISLLLQYLYLAFYIDVDIKNIFFAIIEILEKISFGHEFSPIIASTGVILIDINFKEGNNIEIKNQIMETLIACALARKIKENQLKQWIEAEKLNNFEYLNNKLNHILNTLIAENEWLFNKEMFSNNK